MTVEEIQAELKRKGITQRDLGRKAGLSESVVSILVKNMPKLHPHLVEIFGKDPFADEMPGRGKRVAGILGKIADMGGISGISDPVGWQQEAREDGKLPGREGNHAAG